MDLQTQQIKELITGFIRERTKLPPGDIRFHSVGGGSINATYRVGYNNGNFFLKLNTADSLPGLFREEKRGLEFLAGQHCLRTPAVLLHDDGGPVQVLLLEWIEGGIRSSLFWQRFGEQLAHLHFISRDSFGFSQDNYMGALPQANTPCLLWPDFFVECRLKPQVALASRHGQLDKNHFTQFERLYTKLPSLFNEEKSSLLHGDLWSGNFLCDEQSRPVLIDPAVYFGHRSMDLAMTTLFGGFDKSFYEAYHYHFPFPANHREQWEICNLYPLLVHLNLFGRSYLADISRTLNKYT